MIPALLAALAAALVQQPASPADASVVDAAPGPAPATSAGDSAATPAALAPAPDKAAPDAGDENRMPAGAPQDDYGFVAWCHGALAGQLELDPLVEKDMDAIEGKAKARERHAGDMEISKERHGYLKEYERALSAAEKASPTAIHPYGVQSELKGYAIWAATRNKAPIWRMVDWGNWEAPEYCRTVSKRLYDKSSLFAEALRPAAQTETSDAKAADQPPAGSTSIDATDAPPADVGKTDDAAKPLEAPAAADAAPTKPDASPAPAGPPPADLRGPH